MKIVVLDGGSAARRPQRGVTAIGDGHGQWLLLNMSPAVALRLGLDPQLDQHAGLQDPSARAVLLTDAQLDQVGGLLGLRHGSAIDLYATPSVFESLASTMPVLPTLQHYCGAHWHVVPVAGDLAEAEFQVVGMPALRFTAIAVGMPLPPHLCRGGGGMVGDSIALAVHDQVSGQRAVFAPGLVEFDHGLLDWMREADCVVLDGAPGDGRCPPGWPDADAAGLVQLAALPARHKLLLGAPDAACACACAKPCANAAWARHGFAPACDGMAIEL